MAGIIPNTSDGGVVIRDSAGVCSPVSGVVNAYCPGPDFMSSCDITYLPSDCSARITSAQVNGFESEMLALAEALNPQGFWNCGAGTNLATIFGQWANGAYEGSMNDLLQMHLCGVNLITQAQLDTNSLASFIMCDGAGGIVRYAGRPYVTAAQVVSAICDSTTAKTDLAACLPDPAIDPGAIVAAILADNDARCSLLSGIVLDDPRNSLAIVVGTDGKCYLAENDSVTAW